MQWEVSDNLRLSGGLRYVNIGVSLDDYITADFPRRNMQGAIAVLILQYLMQVLSINLPQKLVYLPAFLKASQFPI